LTLVIAFCSLAHAQGNAPCAEFNKLIKSTYNFRPALLRSAEREQKTAAMEKVWQAVKANRTELLPCLVSALEDPKANPWFLFDGSNLLVSLDPSDAARRIQIRNYAATNLEDVDLRVWLTTMVRRGLEDYDVSAAGERWLAYPKAGYYVPEHGLFAVSAYTGAIFIFGSMDEKFATPALIKIAADRNHYGREGALGILIDQQTPESRRFLRQVDLSTVSTTLRKMIRDELEKPKLFTPRAQPKNTRQAFLDAFQALLNGDRAVFFGLMEEVSDGERDVVAVLTTDDLPLVRKVRRRMLAGGNQHSLEFYDSFTRIIRTIVVRAQPKPIG
jgi:hypothetical protein